MSESESDDEFLSADEGEYEDGKKSPVNIEEDEVDEIMDLLMNNESDVENKSSVNSSQVNNSVDRHKSQPFFPQDVAKESIKATASTTDLSIKEQEITDTNVNTEIILDEEKEEESLEDILSREYENDENEKSKQNQNKEQLLSYPEDTTYSNQPKQNEDVKEIKITEKEPVSEDLVLTRQGILTETEPDILICEEKNDVENEITEETVDKETVNKMVEENSDKIVEEDSDKITNKNSIEKGFSNDKCQTQQDDDHNDLVKSEDIIDNKMENDSYTKTQQNQDSRDSVESDNIISNEMEADNDSQTQEKEDDSSSVKSENIVTDEIETGNDTQMQENQHSNDSSKYDNFINNEMEADHHSQTQEKEDIVTDKTETDTQMQENHVSNNDSDEIVENLDDLDLDDNESEEENSIKELEDDTNNAKDSLTSQNKTENNDMQTFENTSKNVEVEKGSCTKKKEIAIENDNFEDEEVDNGWSDWGNEDLDSKEMEKEVDSMINMPVSTANEKPTEQTQQSTTSSKDDWGWDNWADDFIVQAAGKVSNLLETVEGQLGIPDPIKMAEVVSKEEKDEFLTKQPAKKETTQSETPTNEPSSVVNNEPKESKTKDISTGGVSSWFGGFSSISGIVQNTGTDLVSGGIGALEFIGKRTVDMLSDGDPGLRHKREALGGKKTNSLSAVLREAKNNPLPSKKEEHSKNQQPENVRFIDLFEKFQGNAHLDALEMLSSECESKVERILNLQSDLSKDETTKILSETRENYELSDNVDEKESNVDFKKDLFADTKKLKMKVTCSKLLNTWLKIKEKSTQPCSSPKECLDHALLGLAELVSRCIEYYRKIADMLMITDMQAKDLAVERAKTLKNISEIFQVEFTCLANNFAEQLADNMDDTAQKIVTDIYLEGSNCSSMVKDCHELLLPILQCCIIK